MPLNPLDWIAGPFLTLYVTLTILALLFCRWRKRNVGPATARTTSLKPLEAAYLLGGPIRFGNTLLADLFSKGQASLSENGSVITISTPDVQIGNGMRVDGLSRPEGMSRNKFQKVVDAVLPAFRLHLEQMGLRPDSRAVFRYRLFTILVLGALLAFGIAKARVGVERGKPIGYLTTIMVLTLPFAVGLLIRPFATPAGHKLLAALKQTHARALRAPLQNEIALAVAVGGLAVLAGTAYAEMYEAAKRNAGWMPTSGADGGSTSTDGCGSGDGGGDGGCGGCGGCGGGD
jgi:uncharacterized protein (TIGR04222 family)